MQTSTRRTFAILALATTSLFAAPATYAAPSANLAGIHAFVGKSKTVSFSLHNKSDAPLQLMAGQTPMTVEAGQTISVKLPAGTRITDAKTGNVVVEVISSLSGATVSLN